MLRTTSHFYCVRLISLFATIALCCAATIRDACCADAKPIAWLTGPQLREALERPIDAQWARLPLGRLLDGVAESQRVPIFRDRRVDPNPPVDLAISKGRLSLALMRLATQRNCEISILDGGIYFGPPQAAQRLRTLATQRREDAQALPITERQKLRRVKPWRWDDLATPQALLADLADEAGYEITGGEQIPHDLWAAASWPPLGWTDRLSLIAIQFDLTFTIDAAAKRVRLAPIPERVEITRTYPAGGRATELAQRWTGQMPDAIVQAQGDNVQVTARAEDHELIELVRQGLPAKRERVTAGKDVYKLAVENVPLKPLLANLEQRLSLKVEWDEPAIQKAGIKLDQLVTIDVKDVSLDDLLRAILTPKGLTFTRSDKTIEIRPAK